MKHVNLLVYLFLGNQFLCLFKKVVKKLKNINAKLVDFVPYVKKICLDFLNVLCPLYIELVVSDIFDINTNVFEDWCKNVHLYWFNSYTIKTSNM